MTNCGFIIILHMLLSILINYVFNIIKKYTKVRKFSQLSMSVLVYSSRIFIKFLTQNRKNKVYTVYKVTIKQRFEAQFNTQTKKEAVKNENHFSLPLP